MESPPNTRWPWLTLVIFGLTLAVIFWCESIRPPSPFELVDEVPSEGTQRGYDVYYAFFDSYSLSKAKPLGLFSAWLLHGSWMHWAINAFQLVVYGGLYERARGHAAFAAVFFLAHLSGSIMHLLFGNAGPALGMSAGTWGLIGALAVDTCRRGHSRVQLALRIALVAFAVAMWFESGARAQVDWVHLSGLATGGALAWAVSWKRGVRKPASPT